MTIKKLLIYILIPLWGLTALSQNYTWRWAKAGGADNNNVKNISAAFSPYLNKPDKNDKEFLLNTLPLEIIDLTDKVKFDQILKYKYSFQDKKNTKEVPYGSGIPKFDRTYLINDPKVLPDLNDIEYEPTANGIVIPSSTTNLKFISKTESGGSYLSNEIHYRVSFLRHRTAKRTGHFHVGFLKRNKDGELPTNREKMLDVIKLTLGEVIKNF